MTRLKLVRWSQSHTVLVLLLKETFNLQPLVDHSWVVRFQKPHCLLKGRLSRERNLVVLTKV